MESALSPFWRQEFLNASEIFVKCYTPECDYYVCNTESIQYLIMIIAYCLIFPVVYSSRVVGKPMRLR